MRTSSGSSSVVKIIQNAMVDRGTGVQEARADLELFKAKLEQYRVNPSLMISRDWAGAWQDFQSRDFVQTMLLPADGLGRTELWINEDPEIIKELDRLLKQREREEAAQERERRRQEARFRTERGEVIEE